MRVKGLLEGNRLNIIETTALSVAILAPTMAMSINVAFMAGLAGASGPLVFLISMVMLGFVAVSFIAFNEQIPSAGSVYTFVKASMGNTMSSIAGWLLTLEYWTWSVGVSCAFGTLFSIFVKSVTGASISWMIPGVLCVLAIWYLSYTDVKLSTDIMFYVEAISMLLLLFMAVVVLVKVGMASGLTWVPFTLGGNHFSALAAGMVFAVLSFGGFEGASSLGEESKNPKLLGPIAIGSAIIIGGLFFVFVSYAQTIGFGVNAAGIQALTNSTSSVIDLSNKFIGPLFTNIINLGICASAFSCALGSMVAGSRTLFAMGRDNYAPGVLATVHGKHATPHVAIHIMLVVNLIVLFAMSWFDGMTVYGIVATAGALAAVLAYLLTSLGSMFYFGKRKLWTWQLILPVIAIILLGYLFYSNVYPVPASPFNLLPYIVIAWVVLGVIVSFVCGGASGKAAAESGS
jgi:amino acid transporter